MVYSNTQSSSECGSLIVFPPFYTCIWFFFASLSVSHHACSYWISYCSVPEAIWDSGPTLGTRPAPLLLAGHLLQILIRVLLDPSCKLWNVNVGESGAGDRPRRNPAVGCPPSSVLNNRWVLFESALSTGCYPSSPLPQRLQPDPVSATFLGGAAWDPHQKALLKSRYIMSTAFLLSTEPSYPVKAEIRLVWHDLFLTNSCWWWLWGGWFFFLTLLNSQDLQAVIVSSFVLVSSRWLKLNWLPTAPGCFFLKDMKISCPICWPPRAPEEQRWWLRDDSAQICSTLRRPFFSLCQLIYFF